MLALIDLPGNQITTQWFSSIINSPLIQIFWEIVTRSAGWLNECRISLPAARIAGYLKSMTFQRLCEWVGWSGVSAATPSSDGCHAKGKWTWTPTRLVTQSNLKSMTQYDIVYEKNWKFQSTVSEKFLCIWHHNGSVMRMGAALLGWSPWSRLFDNSQFYHGAQYDSLIGAAVYTMLCSFDTLSPTTTSRWY